MLGLSMPPLLGYIFYQSASFLFTPRLTPSRVCLCVVVFGSRLSDTRVLGWREIYDYLFSKSTCVAWGVFIHNEGVRCGNKHCWSTLRRMLLELDLCLRFSSAFAYKDACYDLTVHGELSFNACALFVFWLVIRAHIVIKPIGFP